MPRYLIAGGVLVLLVLVGAIFLVVGARAGGDSDTGTGPGSLGPPPPISTAD